MDVHFGTVKLWNSRGFGFIVPENVDSGKDDSGDVFVHISNLVPGQPPLLPDQVVQFKMGTGPRGTPQAVEVSVIKDAEED